MVGEVVAFRIVLVQVIQRPAIVFLRCTFSMSGDSLPALVPDRAVPEQFEILDFLLRRRVGFVEGSLGSGARR